MMGGEGWTEEGSRAEIVLEDSETVPRSSLGECPDVRSMAGDRSTSYGCTADMTKREIRCM